jgi:hypothetical protein
VNHNCRNEVKYFIQARGICNHLWRDYGKCKRLPKIVKTTKKLKKTPDNTWTKRMCSFYHKPGHLKKCYWNLENPNNKLKEEKKVLVNEVSPQVGRRTGGNHGKQRNQNQGTSLVYCYFICNSLEHNIYDYPHKPVAQKLLQYNSYKRPSNQSSKKYKHRKP